MTKLGILGAQTEMKAVIDELHELGMYHIKEAQPDEFDIGDPYEEAEAIDEALVTAKSFKSNWDVTGEQKRTISVKEAIDKITEIQQRNAELEQRKQEIKDKLEQHRAYEAVQALLDTAGLDDVPHLDSLETFIGTVSHFNPDVIDDITTAYDHATHGNFLLLLVEETSADDVRDALSRFNYTPVDVPDDVADDLTTVQEEYEHVQDELQQLKENKRQAIIDCTATLEEASERAEAPLQFTVTDSTFYIEGYTPDDDATTVREQLESVTEHNIYVEEQELDDDVPIKFDNPTPAQPFEFFMNLYSRPSYDEIDPTTITFLTFPILFGFMLGDIGYGLVLLTTFGIARNYYDFDLLDILMYSGIWSLLFGVFFGEIFGFEKLLGHHLPHVMHRMGHSEQLLYIAIGFGIAHLNLGLILGAYNEYKRHGVKAALLEKGGWFFLEAAAACFALTYFYNFSLTYGIILALAATLTIYIGEGIPGVVEIPSLFSNTISYARLMAIGLASAGLAIVVNGFVEKLITQGILGILAATAVFLIGHFINICLGILGPTLHSLRLHYVEFFTKFFEGGGTPFKAFGGR